MTVLEQMAAEAQVHYENTSLDMGRLGMRVIEPNSAAIGGMASIAPGQLTYIECNTPAIGDFTGVTYPIGTVLFARFDRVETDGTARLIAHIENRRVEEVYLLLENSNPLVVEDDSDYIFLE